jgi:hypothetical protein
MQVDDDELVESKDDRKIFCSLSLTLFILWQNRRPNAADASGRERIRGKQRRQKPSVLIHSTVFILWQDHGPNAADASGRG